MQEEENSFTATLSKSKKEHTLSKEAVDVLFSLKNEIGTQRTAQEHSKWVALIYEKLESLTNHNDIKCIRERKLPKSIKISDNELCEVQNILQVYFEESIPLAKLCKIYFQDSTKVKVRQIVGNQSCDVQISDTENIECVEITCAKNGHYEATKLQLLGIEGYLPESLIDSFSIYETKDKTRKRIYIGNEPPENSRKVEYKFLSELIEQAVKKKIEKSDHYPKQTLLLVAFENTKHVNMKLEMKELEEFIDERIAPLLEKVENFVAAVLIGTGIKSDYCYVIK